MTGQTWRAASFLLSALHLAALPFFLSLHVSLVFRARALLGGAGSFFVKKNFEFSLEEYYNTSVTTGVDERGSGVCVCVCSLLSELFWIYLVCR